ncbi:MAG: peptidoglycan DD-metalloendopeptidase family protein [Candidatus Melainabacteria bacterium]|nr:peptidoglycan DD-metalloendopeptidase family protein [Candidatus Melainabacteria bacterium]
MLLSFLATAFLPLFAKKKMSLHEKQEILEDLNKKKSNLASKLKEARLKEAYASDKLNSIKRKLRKAQNELDLNRKYLKSNQAAWQRTKDRLEEIEDHKYDLEEEAKKRVLAVYKQNRVKVIDGLINSPSATDYLDHIYYQRRVMEYDKQVIDALMDQTENIKKYKGMLSEEAAKIEKITSRLQGIEHDIAKQKNAQGKILAKLKEETKIYEESERQLERESIKLIYKITELSGGKLDNPDATGSFKYPVKARITSPFGPRRHPIFGVRSMHSGIDLAAPRGTQVKASEGGLVIYAGWYGGYGRVVIVDHSKGYSTLYAHLDRIDVKVGQRIKQGKVVGREGATGYATGPHLHFEVRSKGKPQNPTLYLEDA